MNGKILRYNLRQILNEDSDSTFIDDYTSYQYLWQAACLMAEKTELLRNTQSITTVASQSNYAIDPDYLNLYLRNKSKEYYVKYNDGTNNTFITWYPYEEVVYSDLTIAVTIPNRFTIRTKSTMLSQMSGTADSHVATSGGVSRLTNSSVSFANAFPGDPVYNVTDSSIGIVTSKVSATAVNTALFNGTNKYWSTSDLYIINPQQRFELYLDPPPSTAGHTITVAYIQKPAPVFSDYGMYNFPIQSQSALVKGAAWLYKYRDKEPNFGDAFYKFFDMECRRLNKSVNDNLRHKDIAINLRARK